MGLSVHYSGSLINPELLPELVGEVRDIAQVFEWPCHIYNEILPTGNFGGKNYDGEIYGISFTPPECETVFICFLSNGKMSSPVHLQLYGTNCDPKEKKYLYMLSVKTQFAGIEIHKKVVQLFRYLNLKYFAFFRMIDEGNYWETSDEEVLKENFRKYTELLSNFSTAIEMFPHKTTESIEGYFERLMKIIREKKQSGDKGNNPPEG